MVPRSHAAAEGVLGGKHNPPARATAASDAIAITARSNRPARSAAGGKNQPNRTTIAAVVAIKPTVSNAAGPSGEWSAPASPRAAIAAAAALSNPSTTTAIERQPSGVKTPPSPHFNDRGVPFMAALRKRSVDCDTIPLDKNRRRRFPSPIVRRIRTNRREKTPPTAHDGFLKQIVTSPRRPVRRRGRSFPK